jgi:hypothetical protein
MPGIGKYTKGKKFQLRSGNKPSGFKNLGANENETSTKDDSEKITDNITTPEVNKPATFASKIGGGLVGAFTSGLDAVYGSGKVIPGNKIKFHDPKKKEERKFGTTVLDDDKTENS